MEVVAYAKSVRISPRKVRLVADAVRAQSIDDALGILHAVQKRASRDIEKVIRSALANATNNAKLEKTNLMIASIEVTEAPSYKRYHPSTRGRIHPYKKKGSNIRVVLKEKKGDK